MNVSVCPVAVVQAPVGTVWALLADPGRYGEFWNIHVTRVVPAGPARAGQAVAGWGVRMAIEAVEADRHRIRFTTTLPLGLVALNVITCAPLDATTCRVTYG